MWAYTTILHPNRIQMGLNMNEYALLDIIYHNQTHPDYSNDGWCDKSTSELGEWIGISKGGIHQILVKMEKSGYLEIDPSNTKKRKTTEFWYQNAYRKDGVMVDRIESERSENERNRSESERCRIESERNRSESERHNKEVYKVIKYNKIESKDAHTNFEILDPPEKYSNTVKSDSEKKEKSSAKKEKKEVAIVEEKIACGDLVKNVFLTKSELEHFRRRAEKENLPERIVKMAIDNLSRYIQGNDGYMKKRTYAGAIAAWCWKQAKEDLLKELKFKNEYSKSNSQEPEWKRIARERQGQTS